ncbi:MAG: glutamate synthase-related protein, partial [Thermoanaerobaculia bacterium]
CVGCLRCTTQYPEMVTILPNPERDRLGDAYLAPDQVDTILLESRTGAVPVRGAGYRGRFGGAGWDGMWTDMSEIVRPTRDGIHGREFISTAVDLGGKPDFLHLDAAGDFSDALPPLLSLPLPLIFEAPPSGTLTQTLGRVLTGAAAAIETLALLPLPQLIEWGIAGPHVVAVVGREHEPLLDQLTAVPRMLELDGWHEPFFARLTSRYPETVIAVRVPMDADPVPLARAGVGVVHLVADLHGRVGESFALDLILAAHRRLLAERLRERVTLLGSGGIVAAEHVPKAILAGLDAVALDSAAWVALQGELEGECRNRETARVRFKKLPEAWGMQRLQNLAGAWRDQLLEILGAMGLREVRRLRGELGRCMFQRDLEREAFGEIEGFG